MSSSSPCSTTASWVHRKFHLKKNMHDCNLSFWTLGYHMVTLDKNNFLTCSAVGNSWLVKTCFFFAVDSTCLHYHTCVLIRDVIYSHITASECPGKTKLLFDAHPLWSRDCTPLQAYIVLGPHVSSTQRFEQHVSIRDRGSRWTAIGDGEGSWIRSHGTQLVLRAFDRLKLSDPKIVHNSTLILVCQCRLCVRERYPIRWNTILTCVSLENKSAQNTGSQTVIRDQLLCAQNLHDSPLKSKGTRSLCNLRHRSLIQWNTLSTSSARVQIRTDSKSHVNALSRILLQWTTMGLHQVNVRHDIISCPALSAAVSLTESLYLKDHFSTSSST